MKEYTASELTKYAIKYLTTQGFKCWRQNNLAWGQRKGTITPGIPDVLGFRKADAKFIGVEVKTKLDKMSEAQQQFKEELTRAGGIFIVMRQPEDLDTIKQAI